MNISYNELNVLLDKIKEKINDFEKNNNLFIDYLVSINKEDHILNSMLGVKLSKESIFLNSIEDDISYLPLLAKIKEEKKNIILCQSIYDDIEIEEIEEVIKNKADLYVFNFVSSQKIMKKNIINLGIFNEEILFPWDISQNIPVNQIEKLQNDKKRVVIEDRNKYLFGFSSDEYKKDLTLLNKGFLKYEKVSFQESSKHNEKKNNENLYLVFYLSEYEQLNKDILLAKKKFIEDFGVTHFFEENKDQAILLSNMLSVQKIIYVENNIFYQINVSKISL